MNAAHVVPLVVVAAVLGGATLLVTQFVPADAPLPLSAYGQGDDQTHRFRETLQTEGYATSSIVTGPGQLRHVQDPARTAYVAIGIQTPYTLDDLAALKDFAARGGRLLVADAGPAANPLLAGFGLAIANRTIQDELSPSKDWIDADAQPLGFHDTVRLGAASALIPAPPSNLEVLVRSSASSFLDLDHDERSTSADVPGPFPIVVLIRDANGTPNVFSSDVSLFADRAPADAVPRPELWGSLLRFLLPSGGQVLVDEARHELPAEEKRGYEILGAIQLAATDTNLLLVVGLVAAGGTVWSLSRRPDQSWSTHQMQPRWLDDAAPLPQRKDVRSRLALLLLGRRAALAPVELAAFPKDQLASMVHNDRDLRDALEGRANQAQWSRLEARLEHETEIEP